MVQNVFQDFVEGGCSIAWGYDGKGLVYPVQFSNFLAHTEVGKKKKKKKTQNVLKLHITSSYT